jgi:uncharacterized protein
MREYYIYLTNHCNLNCKYCDGIDLHRNSLDKSNNGIDVESRIQFIKSDLRNRPDDKPTIVLFGGEPTQKPKIINKFIEQTKGTAIRLILHTNGTLLDTLNQDLLRKMYCITVSVDGNKSTNDSYRGVGTYDKIIKNIRDIRRWYQGETLARITLMPESSVYEVVTSLIDKFDNIYWQLENSNNPVPHPSKTLKSYEKDLDRLLDFWIDSISNRKMLNIIPFQFAFEKLLFNGTESRSTPPCGAADGSIMYIDIKGDCYICDKVIGNEKFKMGNIYTGIKISAPFFDVNSSKRCANCEIKYLCSGRCVTAHYLFSPSKLDYYSKSQKIFWEKCKNKTPIMKELVEQGLINKNNLENELFQHNECLP